jgi:hypothetical protein
LQQGNPFQRHHDGVSVLPGQNNPHPRRQCLKRKRFLDGTFPVFG